MEHDQLVCITVPKGISDLDSAKHTSCNQGSRSGDASPSRIIKPKPSCGIQLLQLDTKDSDSVFFFSLPSTSSERSVSEICSELRSFGSITPKEVYLAPFLEYQGRQARPSPTLGRANKSTRRRRQLSRRGRMRASNKGASFSSRSENNSVYNSFDAYSLSGCSRQFSLHSVKSVSCMPIWESVPSCSLTGFADYLSPRQNVGNRSRGHTLKQTLLSGSFARAHGDTPSPHVERTTLCRHSNEANGVMDRVGAGPDSNHGSTRSALRCSPRWRHSFAEGEPSQSSQHSMLRCQKPNSVDLFPLITSKDSDLAMTKAPATQSLHVEGISSCDVNHQTNSNEPTNSEDFLDPKDKDTKQGLSDGAQTGDSSPETASSFGEDKYWCVQQAKKEVRIGRGSCGDVYRGIDLGTGRTIAIKEILVPKDFSKDMEKQLLLLEREIHVMRKVRHANIINYLGAAREGNCINVFMEYVSGGTLGDQLRYTGPLPEDQARVYTKQLLSGLQYLHEQRIVHRDLKGDNLFLSKDNVLKLGDFGMSKELATTLVTDSVAGTPNFMAPEVIACSGHSYAADIWSVGCCMVEMLTGKPPFSSFDNHMAVMFAIIKGKINDEMPAHASVDARDFFRACTQHEPKDRCSARELQEHPWILGKISSKCSFDNSEESRPLKKKKKSSLSLTVRHNTRVNDRAKKVSPSTIPPLPIARNVAGPISVPAAPKRRKFFTKDTPSAAVRLPQTGFSGVVDLEYTQVDTTSSSNISSRREVNLTTRNLTKSRAISQAASSPESPTLVPPPGLLSTRSPTRLQSKMTEFSVGPASKLPLRGIMHTKGSCHDVSTKFSSCIPGKSKKQPSVAGCEDCREV